MIEPPGRKGRQGEKPKKSFFVLFVTFVVKPCLGQKLRAQNNQMFFSHIRNDRNALATEFECHLCFFFEPPRRKDAKKKMKGRVLLVLIFRHCRTLRALRAFAVKPCLRQKLRVRNIQMFFSHTRNDRNALATEFECHLCNFLGSASGCVGWENIVVQSALC